jgi:hypothetical protein
MTVIIQVIDSLMESPLAWFWLTAWQADSL